MEGLSNKINDWMIVLLHELYGWIEFSIGDWNVTDILLLMIVQLVAFKWMFKRFQHFYNILAAIGQIHFFPAFLRQLEEYIYTVFERRFQIHLYSILAAIGQIHLYSVLAAIGQIHSYSILAANVQIHVYNIFSGNWSKVFLQHFGGDWENTHIIRVFFRIMHLLWVLNWIVRIMHSHKPPGPNHFNSIYLV